MKYDDVSHTPSVRQLTEKIKETEQQLKQLIARRNRLLDWRDSRKEMKTMEKFSIQSLPEIIVASHREVIPNYANGYRHRVLRTGGGDGTRQQYHQVQALTCCSQGPLHEACRSLRALLRIVHRGFPLYGRTRLQDYRATPNLLY